MTGKRKFANLIYKDEMALASQSYVGCFHSLSIPITSVHLSPINIPYFYLHIIVQRHHLIPNQSSFFQPLY